MTDERKTRRIDLLVWVTWAILFAMVGSFWLLAANLTISAVLADDRNPWERAAAAAEDRK